MAQTMKRIHIGLSGYSYKPWQGAGRLYPEKLKPRLSFSRYCYVGRFNSVELDGIWYRLPTEQVVQWMAGADALFLHTFHRRRIGKLRICIA